MPSGKKPQWEVRTYGTQRDEIDIDLVAQLVMMLGRWLANETLTDDTEPPHEPDELDSN
ncbi:MAG: hypothetical protein LC776_20015 [Acidobacteria bacterium]|nr:hypothetical protein [Acidobacteriota bacterium]